MSMSSGLKGMSSCLSTRTYTRSSAHSTGALFTRIRSPSKCLSKDCGPHNHVHQLTTHMLEPRTAVAATTQGVPQAVKRSPVQGWFHMQSSAGSSRVPQAISGHQ